MMSFHMHAHSHANSGYFITAIGTLPNSPNLVFCASNLVIGPCNFRKSFLDGLGSLGTKQIMHLIAVYTFAKHF